MKCELLFSIILTYNLHRQNWIFIAFLKFIQKNNVKKQQSCVTYRNTSKYSSAQCKEIKT